MKWIMVATLVVGGCLTPEDDLVSFGEDFERCGTCGWFVVGDVAVVTTVHPGEHAARLGPGGQIQHELGIVRDVGEEPDGWGGNFTDGNWIEFSSTCGREPRLQLVGSGAGREVWVTLDGPPEATFARTKLMFPPLGDPGELEQVTFTRLYVESRASCAIDNLRVMVSGGTLAY